MKKELSYSAESLGGVSPGKRASPECFREVAFEFFACPIYFGFLLHQGPFALLAK